MTKEVFWQKKIVDPKIFFEPKLFLTKFFFTKFFLKKFFQKKKRIFHIILFNPKITFFSPKFLDQNFF